MARSVSCRHTTTGAGQEEADEERGGCPLQALGARGEANAAPREADAATRTGPAQTAIRRQGRGQQAAAHRGGAREGFAVRLEHAGDRRAGIYGRDGFRSASDQRGGAVHRLVAFLPYLGVAWPLEHGGTAV